MSGGPKPRRRPRARADPRGRPGVRAEPERLQKALARAGLGSRRACEDIIRAGRVTVDGRVASLGDRIDLRRQRVEVDGARVPLDPRLRYYALNKPRGVVTTACDPQHRADLSVYLPRGPRVYAVGRLDRDTEGLLLLTNDGELANRLMHPRFGVEKEYLAEVDGRPGTRVLARLVRGVRLEDGEAQARSARVAGRSGDRTALRIVMTEGRKREVRRMLAAVGHPARRLVRVRVGPIRLGRLRPGEVRELEPTEIRRLLSQ
jgi:23S rRNA pseudouridine2605 synthase